MKCIFNFGISVFLITHIQWPSHQLYTGRFRRNVNILGGDSVGHYEKKKFKWICVLILNDYQEKAVWISRPNSLILVFLFVGSDEEWGLQKRGGYARRVAPSRSACCCPHKETWRSTQTKNTRYTHMSRKVYWNWRWDFRKFTGNCNKCVSLCNRYVS